MNPENGNSGNEQVAVSVAVKAPEIASGQPELFTQHRLLSALGQLSTILVSGTIVGLVASLTGLEALQSALLTIIVSAGIYVVLYRRQINRRIQAHAILMVILAAFAATAFFIPRLRGLIITETISRSTGIIAHYAKANDFLPKMGDYIAAAQQDVWLTGVSFYVTLPANKDIILKRLSDGINFRFLVLDPAARNLPQIAAEFRQAPDELRSECNVTVQNLISIYKEAKAKQYGGVLEIKLLATAPKARMYVFDKRRDTGVTFFIPHVDEVNSPNLPGFLVKNISTGIAIPYFEAVDRLWTHGVPLENWLQNAAGAATTASSSQTP
jgi:hypothetical protein